MIKAYRLILPFLLVPFLLSAQSSFKPGLVVTLKGDTLHGIINYSDWQNNPSGISFKSSSNNSTTRFTANDITYFSVSAGYLAEYRRYAGPLSMNNININYLPVGRDTSFRTDTVFLKVVQKGKNLVLYSYSDNFKTRFFIAANLNEQPSELIYGIYYNSLESTPERTVYENTWQKQLYQLGEKLNIMTEAFKTSIERAQFREDDILRITSKLNGIDETDPTKNHRSNPGFFNKTFAVVAIIAIIIGTITEFESIHSK